MITLPSVCRLGVLAAFAATAVAAQTNPGWDTVKAIAAGTEVRIAAGARTIQGTIGRTTDDAVVVNNAKGPQTFDRQQVSVVSVRKPSHRKRNALIGLAAGTGAGLGIGIAAQAKSGQLKVVPNSAVVAACTVAGAVAGTLVGIVIPSGGWREIYRK